MSSFDMQFCVGSTEHREEDDASPYQMARSVAGCVVSTDSSQPGLACCMLGVVFRARLRSACRSVPNLNPGYGAHLLHKSGPSNGRTRYLGSVAVGVGFAALRQEHWPCFESPAPPRVFDHHTSLLEPFRAIASHSCAALSRFEITPGGRDTWHVGSGGFPHLGYSTPEGSLVQARTQREMFGWTRDVEHDVCGSVSKTPLHINTVGNGGQCTRADLRARRYREDEQPPSSIARTQIGLRCLRVEQTETVQASTNSKAEAVSRGVAPCKRVLLSPTHPSD
ncbi:hypothetical protein V8D89_011722, partial [Ganoderma adspersum]